MLIPTESFGNVLRGMADDVRDNDRNEAEKDQIRTSVRR